MAATAALPHDDSLKAYYKKKLDEANIMALRQALCAASSWPAFLLFTKNSVPTVLDKLLRFCVLTACLLIAGL